MKTNGQVLGDLRCRGISPELAVHVAYVVNRTRNAVETATAHPSHVSQADVRRQGHKLAGVWELVSDLLGASTIPIQTRCEILAAIETATAFQRGQR